MSEGFIAVMMPFIEHLCARGLAHETVCNHLDNCWVIGGEILRDLEPPPKSRKLDPRTLLLNAIEVGDADTDSDTETGDIPVYMFCMETTGRTVIPVEARCGGPHCFG